MKWLADLGLATRQQLADMGHAARLFARLVWLIGRASCRERVYSGV